MKTGAEESVFQGPLGVGEAVEVGVVEAGALVHLEERPARHDVVRQVLAHRLVPHHQRDLAPVPSLLMRPLGRWGGGGP